MALVQIGGGLSLATGYFLPGPVPESQALPPLFLRAGNQSRIVGVMHREMLIFCKPFLTESHVRQQSVLQGPAEKAGQKKINHKLAGLSLRSRRFAPCIQGVRGLPACGFLMASKMRTALLVIRN